MAQRLPSPAQQERQILLSKLHTPSQLTEMVALPSDMAAALVTGRTQLLALSQPRPLSAEEAKAIYHAMGVLIETNILLKAHAEELAQMADNMAMQFKGLTRQIDAIADFGRFRDDSTDEGELT